jgi:dihydrofolate reductase
MTFADRLVLTRVRLRPAGDALFPPIDPTLWHEVERTDHAAGPDDEAGFSICVYERLRRP